MQQPAWLTHNVSPIAMDIASLHRRFSAKTSSAPFIISSFHAACQEMNFFDIHLGVYDLAETQSLEHFQLLCSYALSYFYLFGENRVECRVFALFLLHGLFTSRLVVTTDDIRVPCTPWLFRQIRSLVETAIENGWADVASVAVELHKKDVLRVVVEVEVFPAVHVRHAHLLLNSMTPEPPGKQIDVD